MGSISRVILTEKSLRIFTLSDTSCPCWDDGCWTPVPNVNIIPSKQPLLLLHTIGKTQQKIAFVSGPLVDILKFVYQFSEALSKKWSYSEGLVFPNPSTVTIEGYLGENKSLRQKQLLLWQWVAANTEPFVDRGIQGTKKVYAGDSQVTRHASVYNQQLDSLVWQRCDQYAVD